MSMEPGPLRELGRSSVELAPERKHDALRQILEAVDRITAAEGGGPEWFAVKLAVEEVCTNIIEHGYGAGGGPIDVLLRGDDDVIVISIRDRAAPFPPDEAPRPDLTSDWDERSLGGLGWHLVRQLMDRLEYESSATAGNEVTLVKRRMNSKEG